MKRILITGASGFAGGYLAEHVLGLGNSEIFGTYLTEESKDASPVKNKINFFKVDLQEKTQTKHLIQEVKPDEIYHLAAMASVPESFKDPTHTFHANIDAQLNLFESLREENLTNTRILITSSAEVYGYVTKNDLPVNEQAPLRPSSPYSVSKIAQDFLGFQYHLSYHMPIIRVRPFNHVGPRQAPLFVVSDFAKQIAEIEKGLKEPLIKVGNMQAKRDFTDVRDMVKAYVQIVEKGSPGDVYNVGSGKSHKIQEIMDMLISLIGKEVKLENDPSKFRPSDIPEIVADSSKVQQITGWRAEIPFEQTLKDTLDYWRSVV